MKKVTFVILSLIFSATVFAQTTKTANATAAGKAFIVKPIGITNVGTSALDFGKLIAPKTGSATATLDAVAAPTLTTTLQTLTSTVTTAQFSITGSATEAYTIDVTNTPLKLAGETDITLTTTKSLTSATYTGDQTLYVGGQISVASTNGEGAYAGTITVTVSYQ